MPGGALLRDPEQRSKSRVAKGMQLFQRPGQLVCFAGQLRTEGFEVTLAQDFVALG